jgi:homoserine dehydrogenase
VQPVHSIRVGLLGCGHVGGALVDLVRHQRNAVGARLGIDIEITRVAVRSIAKERAVEFEAGILTTDARSVTVDPDIDVVVELIGGIEPARELVLSALAAGKPVVTGNKELLANHGAELYAAAADAGVDLGFEAAVAGGIPFIRPLRESLVGEPVTRVMGIVNGTTNYILSQMTESGVDYASALAEAQSLGYAERDPTADVEGFDAAAKAAIIATIAFGVDVVAGDVYHEGIANVTSTDIDFAHRLGYVVKLLAIVERRGEAVAVRVHPTMLPMEHPLASVRDSFNAVFIEGDAIGELMLYGRGAGGPPTASATFGDLLDAARNLIDGTFRAVGSFERAQIVPIDDLESDFYLNVDVTDRPGVLAEVAGVLGAHGVSIGSMEQIGLGERARIIFITHRASERALQATLRDLRQLDSVGQINGVLRVIGDD